MLFLEIGSSIDTYYTNAYNAGDRMEVSVSNGDYIAVKLDDVLEESIIYCPNGFFSFEVPVKYSGIIFPSEAFSGERHHLTVREPSDDEIYSYRNISLNPYLD